MAEFHSAISLDRSSRPWRSLVRWPFQQRTRVNQGHNMSVRGHASLGATFAHEVSQSADCSNRPAAHESSIALRLRAVEREW